MNITEAKLSKTVAALKEIAQETDMQYGFYNGGDPRNFSPDGENTPEEIAAHKEACAKWTEAENAAKPSPDAPCPSGWITPNIHVTCAPFGPGVYSFPSDAAQRAITVLHEIGESL